VDKTQLDEVTKLCRDLIYSSRLSDSRVFQLARHIWNQLIEGQPVSPQQAAQFTTRVGLSSSMANWLLANRSERDHQGNILGLFGLSLVTHPHQFLVNGQTLFTWCAIDALLYPPLLGKTAHVESRCPITSKKVRLTITPERVEWVDPPSAMVSMVLPDTPQLCWETVDEIQAGFCQHVRLFTSSQAVVQWGSHSDQNLAALTIVEAEQLVRMVLDNVGKNTQDFRFSPDPPDSHSCLQPKTGPGT